MTTTAQALKLFFDETEKCPNTLFEIEHRGTTHFIWSDSVIELIHAAPATEQAQIRDMIVRIDHANAPVLPFLEHLALAFIKMTEATPAR